MHSCLASSYFTFEASIGSSMINAPLKPSTLGFPASKPVIAPPMVPAVKPVRFFEFSKLQFTFDFSSLFNSESNNSFQTLCSTMPFVSFDNFVIKISEYEIKRFSFHFFRRNFRLFFLLVISSSPYPPDRLSRAFW